MGNMHPSAAISAVPVKKTIGEIAADLQAWSEQQPTTTRCGFCDWSVEATAEAGRAAFLEHRAAEHPEKPKRKRIRAGSMPMAPVKDEEARAEGKARAAEIAAVHVRRDLEVEEEANSSVAAPPGVASSSTSSEENPYGLVKRGRGYRWTREAVLDAFRDFHRETGRWPTYGDLEKSPTGWLPSSGSCIQLYGTVPAAREAAIEPAGLGRAREEAQAESAAPAAPPADPLAWIGEARAQAGLEEAA